MPGHLLLVVYGGWAPLGSVWVGLGLGSTSSPGSGLGWVWVDEMDPRTTLGWVHEGVPPTAGGWVGGGGRAPAQKIFEFLT